MEEKEITISLKDIFNIIKKHLVFIIVTVLLVSLATFFVTNFFIPKSYKSSVLLYVETSYDSQQLNGSQDLNSYNYAQKLVATYIKALDTKTFYNDVSKNLNEKYTATELKEMISFVNDGETEIFQVNVVTNDPAESKKIADAVAAEAPNAISNLKDNATLKIVDQPSIPERHSSPSLSKNLLIAFALSLVVTIIIAFLRELLDTKIHYDEESTMLGKYPILSAIPDFVYYNDKVNGKNSKNSKH